MSVIEVAIGYARDPGKFHVQIVESPVGHASADVELNAAELLAARGRFEEMILLTSISVRRYLTDEEKLIQEVGASLFTALLGTGEVAGRYRASTAVTDERGEELRIVVRIDVPELAALPWEAMYDAETGGYVCRQHQLVRRVPVAAAPPPLTVRSPLRILGVVSAPRGSAALNADRERDQLARALAEPIKDRQVEVTWAPSSTWTGLHETLLDGPWHVIHFIGHGDFASDSDEGVLYLTRDDGSADPVTASRFADLLRQARPMPRLVVLNSCQGAAASTGDLFSGTAAALARSGVAAVTAMQYAISEAAAIAFARGFYAALARARGIDDAVWAGRVGILGTSNRTLEWLTPVLYLRGHATQLFTAGPAEDAPAPPRLAQPIKVTADSSPRATAPSVAPVSDVSVKPVTAAVAPPRRNDYRDYHGYQSRYVGYTPRVEGVVFKLTDRSGGLIVYAAASLRGKSLTVVSSGGIYRSSANVVEREINGQHECAAIFTSLTVGQWTLYIPNDTLPVTVWGNQIAEVDLR
jgi:hypothetical protein